MASPEWKDPVFFFFSYEEGGGSYDHFPPVPGHSDDDTDASLGAISDKVQQDLLRYTSVRSDP